MLTSARRGETLTPNPNECNSTLTSGTNNIYPYIDVNDRGHRLRITDTRRRTISTDANVEYRSVTSSVWTRECSKGLPKLLKSFLWLYLSGRMIFYRL